MVTYTGSSSNSSYSRRSYSTKKLSSDLADYAKALDKKRKEEVQEFKQVSTDQLAELDRQDGIQASNDKYQLAQLSKHSDIINEFAQDVVAGTIGKAYIDRKREEGIELYRKYLAGDEEATAAVAANAEQLKEIEEKIASMSKEIGESTSAFLDRKNQEEISLKDKVRALNVRKLGPNIRWGFVRGQLQEAARGYQAHLVDTLHSSQEKFTTKDGTEYIIGNYHSVLDEDHKEEIIRYVEDRYIADNNAFNASETVVRGYLTNKVVETTAKFLDKEFLKNKAQQGEMEQTSRIDQIITAAFAYDDEATKEVTLEDGTTVEVNESKDALVKTIRDIITNGPGSEALVNANVSPHKANKVRIINGLKQIASLLDADSTEELVELLKEQEFEMAGTKGVLEKLFAGDLDLDALLHEAKKNEVERNEVLIKVAKRTLDKEIKSYKDLYLEGKLTKEEVREKATIIKENAEYSILKNEDDNYFIKALTDLQSWRPNQFNFTDSMKEIAKIHGEVGHLTKEDLIKLDDDARKYFLANAGEGKKWKYVAEPIWHDMGQAAWGEKVKEVTDKFNKSIDAIIQKSSTVLIDEGRKTAAYDGLKKELLFRANLAYKNGASATDALEAAEKELQIELQAGTGMFETDGEHFTDQRMLPVNIKESHKITSQVAEGEKVTAMIDIFQASDKPEDILRDVKLFEKDSKFINLEKGKDGIIQKIPNSMLQIVEYSETGYTAIDAINMQRRLHDLEEYKLTDFSPELQLLHTSVKERYPHLAKEFNSKEGHSRALDEMGAVDLNTLLNANVINIDQPIAESDLDTVLERFNINKDEYLNDATLQEDVRRKQINYLLKTALETTNDKNQAILMVATGMRFGEAEMNNYGEGSIFDTIDNQKADYAYDVLDAYYSGDTSAVIGKYNDAKINVANFRELTKFEEEQGYEPNYVLESIIGTKKDGLNQSVDFMSRTDFTQPAKIKAILEILNNPKFIPPKQIIEKFEVGPVKGMFVGKTSKNNPLYDRYVAAKKHYERVYEVLDYLNKGNTKPFLTIKDNHLDLAGILLFQHEANSGIAPTNVVRMTQSPYYRFHDEWMEEHGHLFKGADKKTIESLKQKRMKSILEKSKVFLNLKEGN